MPREHNYKAIITWTGNRGAGTTGYKDYERSHQVRVDGKPILEVSADPAFRGDATCFNPEELFLASLSSCHMLWYLHLCADNGIVVTEYHDEATGIMVEFSEAGRFTEVRLHPRVRITDSSRIQLANELHQQAHCKCYIANSCNFPVVIMPVCQA